MKGQAGATMVELITAVAVTGIIVAFPGTAVYHIMTVSEYGNEKFTALHELQNVAYWFYIDGQEAKAATGGSELELTMTDNSTVTYKLAGSKIQRVTSGPKLVLAHNISDLSFSVNSSVVTMYLVSTPEGRNNISENGTYMVYLRPVEL